MLDTRWRARLEGGFRPLGSRLQKSGITADQVTMVGLAASLACAVAIAAVKCASASGLPGLRSG